MDNKLIFISCITIIILVSILFFSCSKKSQTLNASNKKELTIADQLIAKAINAHGGKRYESAHYEFIFRKNKFTFHNSNKGYKYTGTTTKDGKEIVNVLENGKISQTIDGVKKENLSEKEIARAEGQLNSVVYFATLPYKLKDNSVNKKYIGSTTIKGKEYEVVQISFDEENGGKDFDDIYYYWINKKTNIIDYLAYSFHVNKGGVRFRSAYNPRVVDGIRFQDYVNYKAPKETPLAELPILFEKNELKKLSVIETENVVKL